MNSDFKLTVAVWEVTRGCNLRCKHCGNASAKPRSDELTTAEAKMMIDDLLDLGCRQFCLTGGEPLIRPDLIEVIKYISSKEARIGLITNGLLLSPSRLQSLVDAGVNSLGISVDGDRETHNMIRCCPDAYDRAMAAIKLASSVPGLKVAAVTAVSRMNLDRLEAIKSALIDAGCADWRIQMIQPTGRMASHADMVLTREEYTTMIDKIIEMQSDTRITISATDEIGHYGTKGMKLRGGRPFLGDGSGVHYLAVGPSGEVKGAAEMTDEFIEGNIRVTPIADIWNNPDAFAYNRKMHRDSVNRWCRECRYLLLCRSGVPMAPHRYHANGDVKPLCTYLIEKEQGLEPFETPVITQLLEAVAAAQ